MSLTPGTRLGRYEITSRIGAGGMGEVYRARDLELGRDVAIKVLPEGLARDQELLARFEREARTLAALNHPNVATLHGFELHGERRCLVMELVEGEDLGERLGRGPLGPDEAIALFAQLADGLEAAHDKGIVHRDLKPANIKITGDGRAKILDFGLAKTLATEAAEPEDPSESPTVAAGKTQIGALLGTGPYMSPEQAMGQAIDRQTDIWAFGCCLFEALTGERAFAGDSVAETLVNIKTEEPRWEALPGFTPPAVRRLLGRCLQKNPRRRLRDIGDARLTLEEQIQEGDAAAASRGRKGITTRSRSSRRAVGRAAALVVAALAVAVLVVAAVERVRHGAGGSSGEEVVVLMDTAAPSGVYDDETRGNGGTNADDLNHELSVLPVVLHKETLSSTWDREDQILKQQPDLILIHRSAFFHSARLELGELHLEGEESERFFDHLYAYFDDKLVGLLGYIGRSSPATRFIVYSRGWDDETRRRWSTEVVRRFPALEGRVTTVLVPGGTENASFRDPETATRMREEVTRILELDIRAAP